MATLGDSIAGLLGRFDFIFVFLLAFVIIYGLFMYINPFKNQDSNKGIYAFMAFIVSILVASSSVVTVVVKMLTTWFFVLALFLFLIVVVFGVFGFKNFENVARDTQVRTWIIVVMVVILLFALGNAFGQRLLTQQVGESDVIVDENGAPIEESGDFPTRVVDQGSTASSDFSSNVLFTFIHPKVLGMILIFLVGVFGITFLTRTGAK